jgi:membrane protein implicated in regulation of membrane protease activity
VTGRIVDGVVDYVTGGAVFIGLGIGLTNAVQREALHLPFNAWLLVIVAALSTALHAICSDYFRNGYLGQQKSQSNGKESEVEKFATELSRLNSCKGRSADTVLIRLYLGYLKLQAGSIQRRRSASSAALPVKPATVIFWNLIGPSTHVSFFMLAAFLYQPMVFFFFVVIAANAWLLFLFLFRIFKNTLHRQFRKR